MKLHTLCVSILFIGASAPSLAQTEMPARKAGLWEEIHKSNLSAKAGRSLHCVGEGPDHALDLEMGDANDNGTCAPATVNRRQGLLTLEKRCKLGKSSTHAVATYKGNFASSYEMTYITQITPAIDGRTELAGKIRARWIGACKAGQNPGDVVGDSGAKINLLDFRQSPLTK